MNSPEPIPAAPAAQTKAGWTPTTSTMAGAVLGGALGEIIVSTIEYFTHQTIGSGTASAIGTVCVFAVGYFFPDGGRK